MCKRMVDCFGWLCRGTATKPSCPPFPLSAWHDEARRTDAMHHADNNRSICVRLNGDAGDCRRLQAIAAIRVVRVVRASFASVAPVASGRVHPSHSCARRLIMLRFPTTLSVSVSELRYMNMYTNNAGERYEQRRSDCSERVHSSHARTRAGARVLTRRPTRNSPCRG